VHRDAYSLGKPPRFVFLSVRILFDIQPLENFLEMFATAIARKKKNRKKNIHCKTGDVSNVSQNAI